MSKILIAYYSRSGENYVNGHIKSLKIGNTEVVAKMIKEVTGGDLFKIDTTYEYPASYNAAIDVAKTELHEKARPELNAEISNFDEYDTIILGYPNWWGTMPMVVYSFLEKYDLSGKTILPYCTHEGSGLSSTERDIAKTCPKSTVKKGLAIHGGSSASAGGAVKKWLDANL